MKTFLPILLLMLPFAACDDEENECMGLEFQECYDNTVCEAIPYWGESAMPCEEDERGFSTNCPFEGCRPLGSDCPTLGELLEGCDQSCSYNSYAIDSATGCRTCQCE